MHVVFAGSWLVAPAAHAPMPPLLCPCACACASADLSLLTGKAGRGGCMRTASCMTVSLGEGGGGATIGGSNEAGAGANAGGSALATALGGAVSGLVVVAVAARPGVVGGGGGATSSGAGGGQLRSSDSEASRESRLAGGSR